MSDSIALIVNGCRLEKFLRYRVDADLYCADNYFSIDMADPGFAIDPGMRCQLRINDQLAMTGIIDRVTDADDKRGSSLVVEGRDLMGLLVDSYVETFPDIQNVALKALAEQLIAGVPHINRQSIKYQQGLAGAKANTAVDTASDIMAKMGLATTNTHVSPGQTIFEVLKAAAISRGATFFGLPDGTFVFGRPKVAGSAMFSITHSKDGQGNNAMRTARMRDISRRWSRITVLGQKQGDDYLAAEDINVSATVTDDQMPFEKPYVALAAEGDQLSPAEQARMLLEMQRADGFRLVYHTRGHSQAGRNWTINELCQVRDQKRRIDGSYLVYGRSFEMAKDDRGRFTEVRLGLPGVIR